LIGVIIFSWLWVSSELFWCEDTWWLELAFTLLEIVSIVTHFFHYLLFILFFIASVNLSFVFFIYLLELFEFFPQIGDPAITNTCLFIITIFPTFLKPLKATIPIFIRKCFYPWCCHIISQFFGALWFRKRIFRKAGWWILSTWFLEFFFEGVLLSCIIGFY
jgi:hypothetical protein